MSDLTGTLNESAYDPKRGWNTSAQPFGLRAEDYIEIAKAAAPVAMEQSRTFMRDNGFSFIEIPHKDFLTYEKGDIKDNKGEPIAFREWLNEYCSKRGLDAHADFVIMGPRIKSEDSLDRKAEIKEATKIRDYLGIQFITLKKKRCLKKQKKPAKPQ